VLLTHLHTCPPPPKGLPPPPCRRCAEANHPVALNRETSHVDIAHLLPVHRSVLAGDREAARGQHQRGARRRLHRRRQNLPVTTGLYRRRQNLPVTTGGGCDGQRQSVLLHHHRARVIERLLHHALALGRRRDLRKALAFRKGRESVCCRVLLNRYWGIVTVPGSLRLSYGQNWRRRQPLHRVSSSCCKS